MALYFRLFWLPTAIAALQLVLLWIEHGVAPISMVSLIWFLAAAASQYWAPSTGVWIAGLVMQTMLATYLILRRRLEE